MVSLAAGLAIALLVVWTASSFVPLGPGGALAALTVVGYAYTTGFAEPSLVVVVALVVAAGVVWLFAAYVREEPAEGYLLLGFVAAMGLGPAAHNLLLFSVAA